MKIVALLNKKVSSSLLGLFRIFFGVCMVYEIIYYFNIGLIPRGLKATVMLFPYEGFEWIKLLPGKAPEILLFLSLIAAVCITIGMIYKYAMTFFFLSFTYFFMLDKGFYNNHLYLFILLCGLMIFMPADSAYSISKKNIKPFIPFRSVLLLRFQIFIVYFYGGLAKINHDWLVLKQPVISIFKNFGYTSPLAINFITYGGLLFDLSIGFLLLWKPSRKLAVAAVLMFNIMNAFLFNDIGVFPFFMIGATLLFFAPDMPEKWLKLSNEKNRSKKKNLIVEKEAESYSWQNAVLAVYVILQLILPFRGWLLTSNPDWYGPGQRFSWRMKIQNRSEKELSYSILDMDHKNLMSFDPHTALSVTQINTLIQDPRMVISFAKFLAADAKNNGINNVEVKADVMVSYNGRPDQLIFNKDTDLLKADLKNSDITKWVLPLRDK